VTSEPSPSGSLAAALRDVDAIVERFAADGPAPGIAYGVIADGELVHARGIGTLVAGEDRPPNRDSVFRIASMTKSFTAATIVLLRDEGRLALDDPVARHVPDLVGLHGPTRDSPPVTIRHLLTHVAGLATDDPWGDRQQGLDLAEFGGLLRRGPTFAFPPGTRFEYSNLGYGILGRVVTNVGGAEYRDVVRDRLLRPLGMSATGFAAEDVPVDRLAHGHVKRDGSWLEEPIDGYGALAAMGGIFTSVADLARWVAFFADAYPARDDPERAVPLSRASRREMQLAHVDWPPEVTFDGVAAEPSVTGGGYGYGLFIVHDLGIGTVVGHSGGYPGFGSNMRWHPASGLGVIVFGNARYAPVSLPARDALRALVRAEAAPVRRIRPWPATAAARGAVERLLATWDDALAQDLFSMNVELDEPLGVRRAAFERLAAVHGRLVADPAEPTESDSPAHLAWWLAGERGRVRVEIRLSPEPSPRVQTLEVRSVPEPPPALRAAAEALVASLAEDRPAWPPGLVLAPTVDRVAVERELRVAAARFDRPRLGPPIAGDGDRKATWRIETAHGRFELRLEADGASSITSVTFVPPPLAGPHLAD
jgi:CubicO group peptidase (beta-lactamase class C family)